MLICLTLALVLGLIVYGKTNKIANALIATAAAFFVTKLFFLGSEGFQSEWDCALPSVVRNDNPPGGSKTAPFFFHPEGDIKLTNLYRQLHNLDAIQRTEVFKFGDALAGGGYGIPAEPCVGEAYDRAMMNVNQQIRTDIAATRIPFNEAYDVPTRPLMGNFANCELGNCQWDADADGRILGIPSQVGTQPAFY